MTNPIQSCSASRTEHFDASSEARFRAEGHVSTDALLADTAGRAHLDHDPVALVGKTFSETREEFRPHFAEALTHEAVVKIAEEGLQHFSEHLAEHGVAAGGGDARALGTSTMLAPVAAGIYVYGKLVMESCEAGDAAHVAAQRDLRHMALVAVLKGLPEGFVEAQKVGREQALIHTEQGSPLAKLAPALANDRVRTAVLQARCDEGMKVGCQALAARLDPEKFFAAHPTLRAQYENDDAFRLGFDAVSYAASSGRAAFEEVVKGLSERDARFACEHAVPIAV